MAHGKPFDVDLSVPSVFKSLNAVGSENQIQVERPILELDEVLAPNDLSRLLLGQCETKLSQCVDERRAVLRITLNEDVGVLSRVWKTQQYRAGLPDEKIPHLVTGQCVPDFLRLSIFKFGHSRASPEGFPHTTGHIRRSS